MCTVVTFMFLLTFTFLIARPTAPYHQSILSQMATSGSSSPPTSYSPTHATAPTNGMPQLSASANGMAQLTSAGLHHQLTQSNIQQLQQLHQLQQLSVSSQLALQLNGIPFMLREGQKAVLVFYINVTVFLNI